MSERIVSSSQDEGRLLMIVRETLRGLACLTIASGSFDGTVKLWVWDLDRLAEMGCNQIQQYLRTRPEERDLCEGYGPPPAPANSPES